jgi:hypothetical protein
MRHRVVDLVASHPYSTVSLIARLTLTLGRSSPVVGRSSRGPLGGRTYAVLGQAGRDAVDSYRYTATIGAVLSRVAESCGSSPAH